MNRTVAMKVDTSGAKLAAADIIYNLGISSPQQIQVEDIAMTRGVFVKEDAMRGADSWLIRKEGIGLVRINASIPQKGRKRFAAGHELGHWELHNDLSQAFLCTEADLAGYIRSAPEIEANIFSAE
ncbi:MAG: ImmA/IrrE family metallo-endopeptidase, partial [bacterium]